MQSLRLEGLVSTAWLAEHLDDQGLCVIEVCSVPDDAKYRDGHIPGAAWSFWKSLCWHDTDRQLVSPREMAKRLGAMGIAATDTVVLCGDPIQFGTYAYWVLTLAGHRYLRVLDGGRRKWIAEGRPLTREISQRPRADYVAGPPGSAESRVGRRDVRERLDDPGRLLLDVRSPEEYAGERVIDYSFGFDHGAERKGRIPGAVHLYFRELINEDESFRPAGELRAKLAAVGATPDRVAEIVCYCRLSHRATLVWFAMMRILGYPAVRVYDGSWTEWGSIVGYPIER